MGKGMIWVWVVCGITVYIGIGSLIGQRLGAMSADADRRTHEIHRLKKRREEAVQNARQRAGNE